MLTQGDFCPVLNCAFNFQGLPFRAKVISNDLPSHDTHTHTHTHVCVCHGNTLKLLEVPKAYKYRGSSNTTTTAGGRHGHWMVITL